MSKNALSRAHSFLPTWPPSSSDHIPIIPLNFVYQIIFRILYHFSNQVFPNIMEMRKRVVLANRGWKHDVHVLMCRVNGFWVRGENVDYWSMERCGLNWIFWFQYHKHILWWIATTSTDSCPTSPLPNPSSPKPICPLPLALPQKNSRRLTLNKPTGWEAWNSLYTTSWQSSSKVLVRKWWQI